MERGTRRQIVAEHSDRVRQRARDEPGALEAAGEAELAVARGGASPQNVHAKVVGRRPLHLPFQLLDGGVGNARPAPTAKAEREPVSEPGRVVGNPPVLSFVTLDGFENEGFRSPVGERRQGIGEGPRSREGQRERQQQATRRGARRPGRSGPSGFARRGGDRRPSDAATTWSG